MTKNKKKRKSSAPHNPIPPPARPMPMDGRRPVSYEDLDNGPTPPVPRHMVSYASSDDEGEIDSKEASGQEPETAAGYRHRIMSRESDGTYDANRAQPRTDPTYGQVGAFPGLDTYQFAPFYGPANDGLDYLRMVRSEAREIPHIVTSGSRKRAHQAHQAAQDYEEQPEVNEDEDEDEEEEPQYRTEDDLEGYYSDGAYVAKPLAASKSLGDESQTPQDAYYERLKDRFTQHRIRCNASPSADAVAALDDQHPISYPQKSDLATTEWKFLLLRTTPLPAQLCSMDKWTIWRLMRLCERHIRAFAIRAQNIPVSLAAWIWGLFGRMQESWQMRNEEISKVREFGKCATWCLAQYKLSSGKETPKDRWSGDEEDEEWAYDEDEGVGSRHKDGKGDGQHQEEQEKGQACSEEKVEGGAEAKISTAPPSRQPSPQADETSRQSEVGAQSQDLSDMLAAKRRELEEQQDPQPSTIESDAEAHEEVMLDDVNQEAQEGPSKTIGPVEVVPNAQTTAILDLIITITGDFYGQRDLLWSREKWQKEER